MAKQIIWTKSAQTDRKEILHYWSIRNQSNTYSKKLNGLINKAVKLIAAHPHIKRPAYRKCESEIGKRLSHLL